MSESLYDTNLLDNGEDTPKKESWFKRNPWILLVGVLLLLAAIIFIVVKWEDIKKWFKTPAKSEPFNTETFVTSNIGENDFVNTYIASSYGNYVA